MALTKTPEFRNTTGSRLNTLLALLGGISALVSSCDGGASPIDINNPTVLQAIPLDGATVEMGANNEIIFTPAGDNQAVTVQLRVTDADGIRYVHLVNSEGAVIHTREVSGEDRMVLDSLIIKKGEKVVARVVDEGSKAVDFTLRNEEDSKFGHTIDVSGLGIINTAVRENKADTIIGKINLSEIQFTNENGEKYNPVDLGYTVSINPSSAYVIADHFVIDSKTGDIQLTKSLDYESFGDAYDPDNTGIATVPFELEVSVTNGTTNIASANLLGKMKLSNIGPDGQVTFKIDPYSTGDNSLKFDVMNVNEDGVVIESDTTLFNKSLQYYRNKLDGQTPNNLDYTRQLFNNFLIDSGLNEHIPATVNVDGMSWVNIGSNVNSANPGEGLQIKKGGATYLVTLADLQKLYTTIGMTKSGNDYFNPADAHSLLEWEHVFLKDIFKFAWTNPSLDPTLYLAKITSQQKNL